MQASPCKTIIVPVLMWLLTNAFIMPIVLTRDPINIHDCVLIPLLSAVLIICIMAALSMYNSWKKSDEKKRQEIQAAAERKLEILEEEEARMKAEQYRYNHPHVQGFQAFVTSV
ncbi:hypothetical protein EDC01DRAFT_725299 [Geopyxis carbonaria]|nr:hypothetical protein EDC01DRAFT_725299 [Geopyxis carbonaria]